MWCSSGFQGCTRAFTKALFNQKWLWMKTMTMMTMMIKTVTIIKVMARMMMMITMMDCSDGYLRGNG